MGEHTQYSHENMSIEDIMSEIRQRVAHEAQASYEREHKRAKAELLILRPESRVDLLMMEVAPAPKPKPAPKPRAKPDDFEASLRSAVGISDQDSLEDLIRKVFREEMQALGDL